MVEKGRAGGSLAASLLVLIVSACDAGGRQSISSASSCMTCHNGSQHEDYTGPGLENPHPFGTAGILSCTTCHGGNPNGEGVADSHVPPPPEIGDDTQLINDRRAYFNRLTLTGIDKLPNYTVGGVNYTAIDYLQFINPGDLRVTGAGRSCGTCHSNHAETVGDSLLATSAGVLSGALYAIGADNAVPENAGLHQDTAVGMGFRAEDDPDFAILTADVGAVGSVEEFPVFSRFGGTGTASDIFNNDDYNAADLSNDLNADNSVVTDSHLANLYHEQVAFTCGDCHLGSAGANNRYGDFRSSGCTACHMQYSLDGRSRSGDPNVNPLEPLDPDDIEAPERSHVNRHLIRSVARTQSDGEQIQGIDDYACAGCHQGSNRTVMQYWGIRLDQNEDLKNGVQYPALPVSYVNTRDDTRLFDPVVNNHTFNGRDDDQYILFEDYDGDGRDDTPPDVHYDAGLGCIDCHGSYDLHGGDTATGESQVFSRMEQGVAIRCESCHGTAEQYAPTVAGTTYAGDAAQLAVDAKGNPLRHVFRDVDGNYYLDSRLTGQRHYVVQTRDTILNNGKTHPFTSSTIYSAKASYAMGRDDDSPATGIGPQQSSVPAAGFSHTDNMSCASCHASWTNNCIGCHLGGEYNTNNNNFSNISGARIVFRQANADFVYQSPVPFQLGVGPNNKIEPIAPNTETFFQYKDRNNNNSQIFAFSDRNGGGNNPSAAPHPSMSHNVMMPHSIRGKVSPAKEGPRYCVACHLTDEGLANFGTEYDQLRNAMASPTFTGLDAALFNTLKTHIGSNPGNRLNSPLWVHMVAGLGSGLFLFDENGCPVNPLDQNDARVGCGGTAPADNFDLGRVRFNLDRLVDDLGAATGSNNHPMMNSGVGPNLRDGALDPNLAGPLGWSLVMRLTDPATGIVLNSWLDANGATQGDASDFVP